MKRAALGIGAVACAAVAAAMLFTEPALPIVPVGDACIGDLREHAASVRLAERELGLPVALEQVSETGALWGQLSCVVFDARGSRASGLVGIAAERRDGKCAALFWRAEPPDSVSCEALNAEARTRLTNLAP